MVGLVLQKSHINTKDECHYVALIAELEARGAKVTKERGLRNIVVSYRIGWWYNILTCDGIFLPGEYTIRYSLLLGATESPPNGRFFHLTPRPFYFLEPLSQPQVITLYTGGLDFSGPVEEYFISNGKSVVDSCINLTGFALVGGPASQDHAKAVSTLQKLNVPYMCTVPLVFQSFEEWQASELGLHPIQVALQVNTYLMYIHVVPVFVHILCRAIDFGRPCGEATSTPSMCTIYTTLNAALVKCVRLPPFKAFPVHFLSLSRKLDLTPCFFVQGGVCVVNPPRFLAFFCRRGSGVPSRDRRSHRAHHLRRTRGRDRSIRPPRRPRAARCGPCAQGETNIQHVEVRHHELGWMLDDKQHSRCGGDEALVSGRGCSFSRASSSRNVFRTVLAQAL